MKKWKLKVIITGKRLDPPKENQNQVIFCDFQPLLTLSVPKIRFFEISVKFPFQLYQNHHIS